ncbi:MAG: uroporphyrinogen-III synthase [Bacteroidota bacterium]
MKRIFITRHIQGNESWVNMLEKKGISCSGESFLRFELVRDIPKKIDSAWIFFTSPTAVEMYQMAFPKCNKSCAALGMGTAKGKENLFRFIGSGKDLANIALQFNNLPNSHSVTLISPENGNRSLQPFLSSAAEVVILYKSIEVPQRLPHATAYIFTSPSNARAANVLNDLSNLHVSCLGSTTKKQLHDLGITKIHEFNSWIWEEIIEEIEVWLSNL